VSALGDIMDGLRTVMGLTAKVETLGASTEKLSQELRDLDRRLVRVETIIEVTRTDGATLRIAPPPDGPGREGI